jgi:serine/threonine protein kinase
MSVVYLGYDEQLGRRIALKILSQELSEDDAFRTRFARESQLAAGLEHPNIVPVYEAGESDGLLFIAMRYIEGTDLRGLLKKQGALNPNHALRLLRPIAAALDVAHRRGLVHRDVKPANILISADDRGTEHSYLSDFGLTKHTTSQSGLTKTGQFMGTIDYVAPEQIRGGSDVDGRTDQYSLACVIFETLTGDVPFERETDVARLFGHLEDQPPSVTSRQPQLPQAIDEVVAHGMAKSPDERYENCSDLLDAATSAFEKRPQDVTMPPPVAPTIAATPPPPPPTEVAIDRAASQPAPQPASKSPGGSKRPLMIVASIAVLIAIAVLIVGPRLVSNDEDRAGPETGSPQGPTAQSQTGSDATGAEPTGSGPTGSEPTGTPGVFFDDFSDPASGWGTRNGAVFQAEYVKGRYQVTVSYAGPAYQELKGNGVSGDVRIEVDARAASDAFNYYGVTCHGINATPTSAQTYYFLISTDGDYAIGFFDFGANSTFEDYVIDTSSAINRGAESNRLEATCSQKGQSMKLSLVVNGEFVDSVTVDDPLLLEGRSGLAVHVGEGSDFGIASFDNFQMTEL